jgi:PEP-CTERM motif
MTSIRNISRLFIAAALVAVGLVGTSDASTISILPGSQIVGPGGAASVDIVLSGLTAGETVGGFSAILTWDAPILAPFSYVIDPGGKMGAYDINDDFSLGFGAGTLDLFYLANLDPVVGFPTDALLKASEGDGFVLATVTFTGLAQGVSPLTLSFKPADGAYLSDFDGHAFAATSINTVNGSVCVTDPLAPNCGRSVEPGPVPEPATLSLLAAGLIAAAARRRRKGASQA